MMEEGADFPRGKAIKNVEKPVKTGFFRSLFDSIKNYSGYQGQKQGKKSHTKKKVLTGEEEKILAGRQKSDKRIFDVQQMTYDGLCEGLLTLGCISAIREHELLVSMPGRTVGSVPITSISTPYSKALEELEKGELAPEKQEKLYPLDQLFQIGQIVVVKIISMTKNKKGAHRITLSTNPLHTQSSWKAIDLKKGLVLTGAVIGDEDHGFLLDLGINGVSAFLGKRNADIYIKKAKLTQPLGIGQLVQVLLERCEISRLRATVQTSADPDVIKKVGLEDSEDLITSMNYSLLLPGMLVNEVTIMDTHRTGIKVHALGLIGVVYCDHLATLTEIPADYTVGKNVKARILYTHPNGNSPYLTLQPKTVPYFRSEVTATKNIVPGKLYEVKILRFEKRGFIISFLSGEKGIVPSQRCSDDANLTEDDLGKLFTIGSKHPCRVIEFSAMDMIFIGSFQKSLLKKEALLKGDQVKVGTIVKAKIDSWSSGGASVIFGTGLKGFIPTSHFPVLRNPDLNKKWSCGQIISALVLESNSPKRHVILTALKPLLRSKGVILEKYEDVEVGAIGHGIVSKVIEKSGVQIRTIGGLIGFLPISKVNLGEELGLSSLFHVGKVVEYKVFEMNMKKKQLIFGMTTEEDQEEMAKKMKAEKQKIKDEELVIGGKRKKKETAAYKIPAKKAKKTNDEPKGKAGKENKKKKKKVATDKPENAPDKKEEAPAKKKKTKAKKRKASEGDDSVVVEEVKTPKKVLKLDVGDDAWDFTETKVETKSASSKKSKKDAKDKKIETEEAPSTSKEAKGKKEEEDKAEKSPASDVKGKLISEEMYRKDLEINPKSTRTWRDYISFVNSNQDFHKVKSLCYEALEKVDFRDEKVKSYLWSMLVSVESKIGNETTLNAMVDEGCKRCERETFMKNCAYLFEKDGKIGEAKNLWKRLANKAETRLEGTVGYATFLYNQGKPEEARMIFDKAIKLIEGKEMKTLIMRRAMMEIHIGEVDVGKQIFETLMKSSPSAVHNIMLCYLNALLKKRLIVDARAIFEKYLRGVNQGKLTGVQSVMKRMKDYEDAFGCQDSQERYRVLAITFVAGKIESLPNPYYTATTATSPDSQI